jgi:hypothetical protein
MMMVTDEKASEDHEFGGLEMCNLVVGGYNAAVRQVLLVNWLLWKN